MRKLVSLALVLVLFCAAALAHAALPTAPVAAAGPCAGFADVLDSNVACEAIAALTSRSIINGYATAPPTFGPNDPVQRAQVAAFLVRALAWSGEATTPRTFTDFGSLIEALRMASLILANKCDETGLCVARGYEAATCTARNLTAPCFGPNDSVTYAQVISFVARAFQFDSAYEWQPQPNGAMPYFGVPVVHQPDVQTYYAYAGGIPDAPMTEANWSQPAPRGWVARVLYQALGPLPSSNPSPSPSPSNSPEATDFKAVRLSLISQAITALLPVTTCGNPFNCFSTHLTAQTALNQGLATLLAPPNPTPPECAQLAAKVLTDWSTASQQMGGDTSTISGTRAVGAAAAATLGGTRETILNDFGTCH